MSWVWTTIFWHGFTIAGDKSDTAKILELILRCTLTFDKFVILDEIGNPDEILAFLAIKTDSRPDAADIKKDMERKKGW